MQPTGSSLAGSLEDDVFDLEALGEAEAYSAWLASFARPHLGRSFVELGSGLGNLSRHLLPGAERAWLVEGEPRLAARLRERLARPGVEVVVADLAAGLATALAGRLPAPGVDCVFSSNVLEHLPDDEGVLRETLSLLRPGGASVHVVPAEPWLYNGLDRRYGHLRRYDKARVRELAARNGWRLESMQYVNLTGMLGWVLGGGGRRTLSPLRLRVFEQVLLPFERGVARLAPWLPAGLSLVFRLRKPA